MAKSILLKCLVITLITRMKVAAFPKDVKKEIERHFDGAEVDKKLYPFFLHILENSKVIQGYQFAELMKYDKDYLIFTVKKDNTKYEFKIIFESQKDHVLCDIEQRKYQITYYSKKSANISYIFETIAFEHESHIFNLIPYNYCTSISEVMPESILNSEMFTNKSDRDKIMNSHYLFILIGKVIISIAELNFKSNVLHRNINIGSIGAKPIGGYIKLCESYDPVIIGLTKMIQNPSQHLVKANEVKDEMAYFLPETRAEHQKSTNKIGIYPYSKEFFEDVYALGPVIKEIIEDYKNDINNQDPGISKLKNLADQMIQGEEKTYLQNSNTKRRTRIDMKRVLELYYEAMKSSIQVGKFNPYKNFLPRVEDVIKSFKNFNFII